MAGHQLTFTRHNFQICSDKVYKGLEISESKYSKTTIEKILRQKKDSEETCGPYLKVPCLKDESKLQSDLYYPRFLRSKFTTPKYRG